MNKVSQEEFSEEVQPIYNRGIEAINKNIMNEYQDMLTQKNEFCSPIQY